MLAQDFLTALLQARVVDLTHALHPGIPFWPGAGYAPFDYRVINTLDRDGVAAGVFAMPEHMGTHLDAPCHFTPGGVSVDALPASRLVCAGVVLDISARARHEPGALLDVQDVAAWHDAHGPFPADCVVLVHTGWAARWKDPAAFANRAADGRMVFPAISAAAARTLAGDPAVRGIGLDTLSADNGLAERSPCHHLVHGAGKFVLENLAQLEVLPPRGFAVFMGALPIVGGTGSPARILAVIPDTVA